MKKVLFLFVAMTSMVAVGPARGNQFDTNPIDAAMDNCLSIQKGNMPRAKCYSDASEAWQKDVDIKYSELLKRLPKKLLPTFKASQTAWEKYRDAELSFLSSKEAGQTGTGHISGRIIERMAIYRDRAVVLDDLYETYSATE